MRIGARARARIFTTLAVLAMAACSAPTTTSPQAGAASAPPGARPGAQKTLTVGVTNNVDAFSLVGSGTTAGGWHSLDELHSEGLMTADRDSRQPVPRLITQVPSLANGQLEVLPDGREKSTYTLRRDVTWQDGVPFTADDMTFSYELDSNPDVPFVNRDAIIQIDSVEAPDAFTFVIYWKAPYYQADSIGLRGLWPQPRHLLEGPLQSLDRQGFINLPYWTAQYVHLGPYRLTDFQPAVSLTFSAYDGYFLGHPKLAQVIVREYNDENTLYAATLAGSIDMLMDNSLGPDRGLKLKDEWDRSGQGTVYVGTGTTRFLAPQFDPQVQTQPAILNPQVRQALVYAIDRGALSAAVQDGHAELIANSILAPDERLYDSVKDGWAMYTFDPGRAQAMLRQLGWTPGADGVLVGPDGGHFTTALWTTEGSENEIAAIADYWKQIGVAADQYVFSGAIVRDRAARSKYPGFETSARGGGDSVLARVDGRNTATAANAYSGANRGQYASPQLDALIDRYVRSVSLQDQGTAIKAVSDFMVADLPVALLYFNPANPAVRKGVQALDDFRGGAEASQLYGTFSRNAYMWDIAE